MIITTGYYRRRTSPERQDEMSTEESQWAKQADLLMDWVAECVSVMDNQKTMEIVCNYMRIIVEQNNFSGKDRAALATFMGLTENKLADSTQVFN